MRYLIVVEKANDNYSAYVPDVPGCITTGPTIEQTIANLRQALEFHLEGMAEDGLALPEAISSPAYVDVEVPPSMQQASPAA